MNNSPLAIGFMKLRKNKLAIFGLIMLTLLTLAAVFAPLLATHERDKTNLREMYAPPSKEHILGTDELGRDVYTRLIYGARVSLSVGLFSTAIATLIGVTLGSVAGYFGGIIDDFVNFNPFLAAVFAIAAAAIAILVSSEEAFATAAAVNTTINTTMIIVAMVAAPYLCLCSSR